MRFSQMAGTAIVPTLARLVLGLAFITVGYNKLATNATFSADEAATLADEYGVEVTPVDTGAFLDGDRVIHLAQSRQPLTRPEPDVKPQAEPPTAPDEEDKAPDMPAEEEDPPVAEPEEPTVEPPAEAPVEEQKPPAKDEDAPRGIPAEEIAEDPVEAPEDTAPEAAEVEAPAPQGEDLFEARSMHKVTLLCHDANWPRANWLALMASLTEFVGGILLIVGLFSRIWGLGLSVAMGVAFYLVSMKIYGVHEANPFEYAKDIGKFNTAFSQLGLFVLAFGILLTGPGPLSLDRLLFRKPKATAELEDGVIIYDDPVE